MATKKLKEFETSTEFKRCQNAFIRTIKRYQSEQHQEESNFIMKKHHLSSLFDIFNTIKEQTGQSVRQNDLFHKMVVTIKNYQFGLLYFDPMIESDVNEENADFKEIEKKSLAQIEDKWFTKDKKVKKQQFTFINSIQKHILNYPFYYESLWILGNNLGYGSRQKKNCYFKNKNSKGYYGILKKPRHGLRSMYEITFFFRYLNDVKKMTKGTMLLNACFVQDMKNVQLSTNQNMNLKEMGENHHQQCTILREMNSFYRYRIERKPLTEIIQEFINHYENGNKIYQKAMLGPIFTNIDYQSEDIEQERDEVKDNSISIVVEEKDVEEEKERHNENESDDNEDLASDEEKNHVLETSQVNQPKLLKPVSLWNPDDNYQDSTDSEDEHGFTSSDENVNLENNSNRNVLQNAIDDVRNTEHIETSSVAETINNDVSMHTETIINESPHEDEKNDTEENKNTNNECDADEYFYSNNLQHVSSDNYEDVQRMNGIEPISELQQNITAINPLSQMNVDIFSDSVDLNSTSIVQNQTLDHSSSPNWMTVTDNSTIASMSGSFGYNNNNNIIDKALNQVDAISETVWKSVYRDLINPQNQNAKAPQQPSHQENVPGTKEFLVTIKQMLLRLCENKTRSEIENIKKSVYNILNEI